MIITTHGAAAVIASVVCNKISKKDTIEKPLNMFLLGILPDLPLAFLVLSDKFDPAIHYHHKWITHTPIFWLIASLLIMKLFSRRLGLALLTATWLHLGMDWYGGGDGIAFLYPFTDRQFGASLSGVNGSDSFWAYIRNPLFLVFEVMIQGTFFAIIFSIIKKTILRRKNK